MARSTLALSINWPVQYIKKVVFVLALQQIASFHHHFGLAIRCRQVSI